MALAGLALAPVVVRPTAAAAHPLGNFTVNRYSRIELAPGSVRVRYVLDVAEIPTVQALPSLDANRDGVPSEAERQAFASRKASELRDQIHLSLDGRPVQLHVATSELELLPGQAGLQTMTIKVWLEAPGNALSAGLPGGGADGGIRLDYRDDNEPQRVGWREIVIAAAGGIDVKAVTGQPLPMTDVSDELRTYPDDLLMSPLDVRRAQAQVGLTGAASTSAPGISGAAVTVAAQRPDGGDAGVSNPWARFLGGAASQGISRSDTGLGQVFEQLSQGTQSLPLLLTALVTAMVLGSVHALSPGHGKTIVGAYLVGTRGTARHALFLGLTVTTVHTAGVFALGIATLAASHQFAPELVYPWMGLVSGALVLLLGASLLATRWREWRQSIGWQHDESPSTIAISVPRDHEAGPGGPDSPDSPGLDHHEYGLGTHSHALDMHPYEQDDHDHGRSAHRPGQDYPNHESAGRHNKLATHTHGLGTHNHAIPGANGAPVTWRSLLALGVSGGLLPCPSALVVMLAAMALGQVALGLVLIVAFSLGLAATLVAIGLLMVYSGRGLSRLEVGRRTGLSGARRVAAAMRAAPVLSAGAVTIAGLALTYQAVAQMGLPSVALGFILSGMSPGLSPAAAAAGLMLLVAGGAGGLALWGRDASVEGESPAEREHRHAGTGDHVHAGTGDHVHADTYEGANQHGHDHRFGHEPLPAAYHHHARGHAHNHAQSDRRKDSYNDAHNHSHEGRLVPAWAPAHEGHEAHNGPGLQLAPLPLTDHDSQWTPDSEPGNTDGGPHQRPHGNAHGHRHERIATLTPR